MSYKSLPIAEVAAALGLGCEASGAGRARLMQGQDYIPAILDLNSNAVLFENGERGDAVDLVMVIQSCNGDEAEEWIGKQFKISKKTKPAADRKKSQADRLIELLTDENSVLFHDQFKDPHAQILVGDHWETWRIKSKFFKRWLCEKLWESEGKAPHANALASAINILESKAYFKGSQFRLENRIAWHEEAIWYDLANEQWEAVRISPKGWEVVTKPPILFRRHAHQTSQIAPARNGDARALLPLINLANDEELLVIIYIASCFIPDIPHPIPILYGPQGAAKTTLARMMRRIIDPSAVEVLSMPTTPNDLIQQLSHHCFAFFDNITVMPEWASDALCRAVTGEGFSKRELYSDDDDVIYAFRRCVGLNGINLAAKKPDLLDRGILFKLERIPKERRQGEKALWEEFERVRPSILGGILDAVSAAMGVRKDISLSEVPRMADFALWGCALARAFGADEKEFIDTYYSNIGEQHEEAINENSVAAAISIFMEEKNEWEGSASSLLEALEATADNEKISTKSGGWPRAANSLSRKLNEVKTNLAEVGIYIDSHKGTSGRRIITISKTAKKTASTATELTNQITSTPPQLSLGIETAKGSDKNDSGGSGDLIDFSSLPDL